MGYAQNTAKKNLSLTGNERRDAVGLIEANQPLPDKYRFLLFEDKQEVELVWNGKANEVCNVVLQHSRDRRRIAAMVADVFSSDTVKIV